MRNPSVAHSPQTTSITSRRKIYIFRAVAVLLALVVWQTVSTLVDLDILLPSPLDVVARLSELVGENEFLATVGFTLSRIAAGSLCGILLGLALALCAGRFPSVETLLWPYMLTFKSVPVASFVVLALIWIKASNLSILISFLMVLPIVYTNILEGIRSVDKRMIEMADVFRMPFRRRMRYIWLPSVEPFAMSAARVALGLAWKSGVAAELIGAPEGSIGEILYDAKLYIETENLFAWTVVIVLLSVVFEKLFVFLLKYFFERSRRV